MYMYTRVRHRTTLFTLNIIKLIDRIECDVTIQISALQHGVCEHVRVCACMSRRNQTGNAACLIDVRIYTCIQFAPQDVNFYDFHGNEGVI